MQIITSKNVVGVRGMGNTELSKTKVQVDHEILDTVFVTLFRMFANCRYLETSLHAAKISIFSWYAMSNNNTDAADSETEFSEEALFWACPPLLSFRQQFF